MEVEYLRNGCDGPLGITGRVAIASNNPKEF